MSRPLGAARIHSVRSSWEDVGTNAAILRVDEIAPGAPRVDSPERQPITKIRPFGSDSSCASRGE